MVTTNYSVGSVSSTPVQRSTFLNSTYHQDVYSFYNTGNRINLHLFGMQADGDDADLQLYRDTNNNRRLDIGIDTYLSGSARSGNGEDSINFQTGTGNYLAVVNRYRVGGSSLPYKLNLSTGGSTSPSNLLPHETSVGTLSSDRTFSSESVGSSDTTDTYSFSLGNYRGVNIRLNGSGGDADIRLIRDVNNDRIVQGSEVLRSSTSLSSTEAINNFNDTGSYFLQVYSYSGSTNYSVTFDQYNTSFA